MIFKLDCKVTRIFRKKYEDNFWNLIILSFAVAGFIGLWFAIRAFGITIMKSIIIQFLETGEQSIFNYATNQIFLILGYVLAADLCFKLVRTFSDIGCSNQETKKGNVVPKLLDAIVQAVIIGLITFIPRYNDETLLTNIGNGNRFHGSIIYVVLFITLIVILLLLIWFRKREFSD